MKVEVKKQIDTFYAVNKAAVDKLATYLGIPSLWLVAVFHLESGLKTTATSGYSGAVGLNQMMKSTLKDYNLTPEQYKGMSAAAQMDVMAKFFKPIRNKIKRAGDLYLYNFYPAAVINNYAMDYAIGEDENFTKRYGVTLNAIYDQNAGLDYNKDKRLTRQDIVDLFESRYDEVVKLAPVGGFFFNDLIIDIRTSWIAWVTVIVIVIVLFYVLFKYL